MVSPSKRLAVQLRPLFYLGQNKISLAGVILTTSAALTMVATWIRELTAQHQVHPYVGIIVFLILPGVFLFGLALIPLGIWFERRSRQKAGDLPDTYPEIDFNSRPLRRLAAFVSSMTILNFAIMGISSYMGLEYMDSVSFCGEACHKVMSPELTAYKNSPHSRVSCVDCHIGPGASWFVKSKLSGLRQVFAVTFDTHSRPIPSPVHELRPARGTCEQCHWPRKFSGDHVVIKTRFADDEKNTTLTTVLVLRLGGETARGGVGIHGRHLDEGSRISYLTTDGRRMQIPRVSYKEDSGKSEEYVSEELKPTPEQIAKGENRSMDCIDCHNRPTHAFELPERGVDRVIREGRVSRELPFVKKKAVELLKAEYPDRDAAAKAIVSGLKEYYEKTYPDVAKAKAKEIEQAGKAVADVYLRNVFPSMKLKWGTHPNHIGHEDFPGCFRCHDGNHKATSGKVISADCDACHQILAQDEENPPVLKQLGMS